MHNWFTQPNPKMNLFVTNLQFFFSTHWLACKPGWTSGLHRRAYHEMQRGTICEVSKYFARKSCCGSPSKLVRTIWINIDWTLLVIDISMRSAREAVPETPSELLSDSRKRCCWFGRLPDSYLPSLSQQLVSLVAVVESWHRLTADTPIALTNRRGDRGVKCLRRRLNCRAEHE